ncbi:hypothetical protein AAFF_G00433790 [Aldrovandia affinis]|uniref:Reverse transcriptase/retrotransposon-derived protein RNase H-like domain-containing protein n=1 Tax=Aldrovandia affinis TaxID=143900 RepID=A0AAD7R551_9TELE|nr:hypothetical protein AAFF_G00433790 [Aldrovandia affinis]
MSPSPWLGAVFGPGGHGFDCGDADEARHGSGGDTAGADVGAAEDGDGEQPHVGEGKGGDNSGGLSVELRVWVAEVQDPCILGQLTSPAGSTPLSPSAAPFTPSAPLPLAQPNMEEEADRLAVVRGIWERSCDAEIGRTHLVHHQIDTGDARPIRSPPRRLPMAYREAAECAIDEMQHAGIIEPSASPWAGSGDDLSLPFVLDTDASNVGMGAVLSQVGPEGERAVAYFSHTFNKAERNYCVTRRELLAVVKAVRHFRELQVIGAAEWRTQQEQDSDLQPVLQWVETGQRPPWGGGRGHHCHKGGLWADFAALRVCDGVLQRA